MHVLDMRKAIGRGDDARIAVLALHFARDIEAEITLDGRDAAAIGDLAHIRRLDAEDAMSAFLEIRDQRAVIRADIDDEVVGFQRPSILDNSA